MMSQSFPAECTEQQVGAEIIKAISMPIRQRAGGASYIRGGLSIIANAPHPAGIAILHSYFDDEAVHPLGLLLAALPPTIHYGISVSTLTKGHEHD